MKTRSILLAGVLMLWTAPVMASVSCPPTLIGPDTNYALESATIYDGPPSDMAQVSPDDLDEKNNAKWQLQIRSPDDARTYFMVCHFEGTDTVDTRELPRSAKACAQNHNNGMVKIFCQ